MDQGSRCPAEEKRTQREIEQEIEEQRVKISCLNESLNELERRLEPILFSVEPENPKKEIEGKGPSTALGQEIRCASARIGALYEKVDSILDRSAI